MGVMTRAAMRNLKNRREWVLMPEAEANLPETAMAPKQAAEININPIPSKWPIFPPETPCGFITSARCPVHGKKDWPIHQVSTLFEVALIVMKLQF
jgi:hypothetical protein